MGSKGSGRFSPKRIQMHLKRQQALRMRVQEGLTFDEIARRLGYAGRPSAWRAIERELVVLAREEIENDRTQESDRLDAIQLAIWPQAMSGDLEATKALLALCTRRANLLGLDLRGSKAKVRQEPQERETALIQIGSGGNDEEETEP